MSRLYVNWNSQKLATRDEVVRCLERVSGHRWGCIFSSIDTEAGYGAATYAQLVVAEAAISAAFDRGRDKGAWRLDDDAAGLFAVIVTTYDEQLRGAPLWAIAEASERLDRFQVGKPYQRTNRTPA